MDLACGAGKDCNGRIKKAQRINGVRLNRTPDMQFLNGTGENNENQKEKYCG